MTVTYKKLARFREIGTLFLRNYHSKTKLHYAIKKIIDQTESIQEGYVDQQDAARIDLAMVDDATKKLLVENGEYTYTRENKKMLLQQLRALSNKEIVIGTHIVTMDDVPPDLSFQYTSVTGAMVDASDYDIRSTLEEFVIAPDAE